MAEQDSAVQGDISIEDTGLSIQFAAQTHTGLQREQNEDDFLILPDSAAFVIADGMGGHNAGREASAICVHTIDAWFAAEDELLGNLPEDGPLRPASVGLAKAFLAANRSIFESALENPIYNGMGTTVVGLRLVGDLVSIAHAGDSRAYLYRQGRLRQLTEDHSLSNFLFTLGRTEEASIADATMSNVIMRALGLEPVVQLDVSEAPMADEDIYLLCSDGLSDLVSRETMSTILGQCHEGAKSLEDAVEELVGHALDAGGRDNITIIVLSVKGVSEEVTARALDPDTPPRSVIPVSEARRQAGGAATTPASPQALDADNDQPSDDGDDDSE